MTDVYIISTDIYDTGAVQVENIIKSLPENLYKRVAETKNDELRKERVVGYSLLSRVVQGKEIFFTELGKPKLKSCEKYISISHTGGACAVAVSDDGDVGVDIEAVTEDSVKRAKKAKARFFPFAYLDPSELSDAAIGDINVWYVEIGEDRIKVSESPGYMVTGYSGPLYFWVSAEAILKADGRGFSAAEEIEEISYRMKSYATTGIKYKENLFFLSVAVMKK